MMPQDRQGGAVHIVIFIMVIVVALVGWGLWYGQYSDNDQLVKNADSAQAEFEYQQGQNLKLKQAFTRVASVTGGIPSDLPEPGEETPEEWSDKLEAMLKPVRDKIAETRSLFGGQESSVQTLFDLPTPAEAMLTSKENANNRLQRDVQSITGEKTSAEQANVALVSQHSTEIDSKNNEISQLRERHAGQLQQQEDEYKRAAAERDEVTRKYETSIEEHRTAMQQLSDKVDSLEREVRDFKSPLKIKRMREKPDGKIIAVDRRAGLCWIDIGSRDLLRRGTRFKAFGRRKGGERIPHGYITVQDVEARRALCAIDGNAEVEQGDTIFNPHFDADGAKVFHLLGKLPGRFNNQQAQSILEGFGAVVSENLTIHVDFLVLGDNPDPEAIGPDADPNWFKSTPAYNDALRWGIEVIRARDLESFLQY